MQTKTTTAPYPMNPLFRVVNDPLGGFVHPRTASVESFQAKVQGENQEGNHFNNTIQSQQGF